MIVDGVGYTPGQIRRLVQERHQLATAVRERCHCGTPGLDYEGPQEDCPVHGRSYDDVWALAARHQEEAHRLRLQIERLQRAAESQQVHLQRRTAALVRLIARKGPRLS